MIKMKYVLFMFIFCILIVFYMNINQILAEDTTTNKTKEIKIEEVVVTATRVEEPKKEVSTFVQVIKKEDVEQSPAKNVGDILIEAGIGHVHKYPGCLTGRIGVRGLYTDLFDFIKNNVSILTDGSYAGTANLAKIPLDDVERIEIVKGPTSVIYGSQAMGGVINIITKRAKKEGFHAKVGGEGGSWNYYKGKIEMWGKRGIFDFYILGTRSARNDYEAKGYGEIENTAYDDESFSAKFGIKLLEKHDFLLSYQHYKGWKIGTPGGRYNPTPKNYADKGRDSYSLNYKSFYFSGKVYYISDIDEWHSFSWGTSLTRKETKTIGFGLQKDFSFKIFKFVVGGDWNKIKINTKRTPPPPYFPNSEYKNWGIFGEGKIFLFDKKLILSLGLRYDYFKDKIKKTPGLTVTPKEEDFDYTCARGGLIYKISEDLSFKTNIGTGFRAPAPDELATDFVSSWGTRYLGNPDLDPEKSITWDFGFEYISQFLNIDISYFMTNFKDKIVTVPHPTLANTVTYENMDGAEIQGLELTSIFELAPFFNLSFSFQPFINLTYHTKYKNKDEKEIKAYGSDTLLYTPKWTATFGIKTKGNIWALRFYGIYIGDEKVIDWDWKSPTYRKAVPKKDFTIFNLAFSITPYKYIEANLYVENLFNRKYEYVQYFPMPKRTIFGGINIKF